MHRRTHHRDAVDLCEEMVGSFETGQCVVSVFEGKIQLSGIASAAGRVTPGPGCTCIGSAEFGGSGEYRFEYSMQTCELRWSRAGARQMNVWRKDGECETGCSQDEVTTVAPHLTAESPLAQAAFAHQVAKETLSAAEAAEAVVEAAQAEGQSGPAVEKARQKMFSARKAIAVARSAEQRVAQLSAAVGFPESHDPVLQPAPTASLRSDHSVESAIDSPMSWVRAARSQPRSDLHNILSAGRKTTPHVPSASPAAPKTEKADADDSFNACKLMAGDFESGTSVEVSLPVISVTSEGTKMTGSISVSDSCVCSGKVPFPGAGEYTFKYHLESCAIQWVDGDGVSLNKWTKDGPCVTKNQCAR
mmetsp:Transcript_47839/g.126742  ORF Transcript_47839/g.126742 Transcript_47839/m.126742 type:complete len:361 (-) Transcript_47839:33-1115(-)